MNPYFEQMILSASPVELIRLLYQRATSSVCDAREHLRNRRISERCTSINVAYAVLLELTGSLRDDESPELAGRLTGLYGYMQARLIDANTRQADEPLAEVLQLLTTLAEAWNVVPDAVLRDAAAPNRADGQWDAGMAAAGAEGAIRIAVSA